MAATEAQYRQALLDIQGRRSSWNDQWAQLVADANAYSTQQRGKPLPAANNLGQLPATGAQTSRVVGGQELSDVIVTIYTPDDVPWQNLANKLADTKALGDSYLDAFEKNTNDALAALLNAPGQGAPKQPSTMPGKDPSALPPWVDFLTELIAYVLVFWGLVVAAEALGFFSWLVAIALAAITWVLRDVIVKPVASVVRIIFGTIIQILIDVVEFIGQWFNAIIQYFQGDFVKAILRMVLLAAFMWIWELAQSIPAIANILDFAKNAVGQAVKFIQTVFDDITKGLEALRRYIDGQVTSFFGGLGAFGQQLASGILQQVDSIFTGLESRFNLLRFELLQRIDILTAAANAQITLFGVRIGLLPDEIRKYLTNYEGQNPVLAFGQAIQASTAIAANPTGNVLPPPAPWDAMVELAADLSLVAAGGTVGPDNAATELIADLTALLAGTPPDVGDWPGNPFNPPATQTTPISIGGAGIRPSYIPASDWALVQGVCGSQTSQLLVAAIGWIETHWGQLGAGQQGYILGVGVTDAGPLPAYQGLGNQLAWACPRLDATFPSPASVTQDALIAFGRTVWLPDDPVTWGQNVFQQFVALELALGVGVAP